MMQSVIDRVRQAVFTSRFQFLVMMALSLAICAPASADQQVALGWDVNPDPTVAGYLVNYGTASGIYTTQIDAGTNDTAVVSGLAEGVTYYIAVTSYDASGVESVPSNEISYTVPTTDAPMLAAVPDQTVIVGQKLIVTNTVVGSAGGAYNFSLLAAPAGMQINPTNGILYWTPTMSEAGSTNLVMEQVSDTNTPPLTSTQTFAVVVGNAVQTSLASGVISVGQTGAIVLTMTASGPVAGLFFTLDAPPGLIDGVTAQWLAPQDATLIQNPPGAVHSIIAVEAPVGEVLPAQIQLQINLSCASGQLSSFGSLQISALEAFAPDGSRVPTTPPASSRLVFVGADSLMDLQVNSGSGNLTVYGPVGASYQIQSTTDLSNRGAWTNEFSTTLTNLYQSFPNLPVTAPGMKFYRAQRQ
jgi:hypothetical protein